MLNGSTAFVASVRGELRLATVVWELIERLFKGYFSHKDAGHRPAAARAAADIAAGHTQGGGSADAGLTDAGAGAQGAGRPPAAQRMDGLGALPGATNTVYVRTQTIRVV